MDVRAAPLRSHRDAAHGPGLSTRRFNPNSVSDFSGLISTINGLPNRASFYSQYDVDGNGTITSAELASRLTFTTPRTRTAPSSTRATSRPRKARRTPIRWSRASSCRTSSRSVASPQPRLPGEQWKHFATTGENIFTFDWEFAPRLSLTYDLRGDGRQKLCGFWGRYYDPIRNNMTHFAGTLNGQVIEEQLFINNQWVTYRTRGGAVQQDAFFSPTTQTPYTDDTTIRYQVDLGRNMSFETAYTNRKTRDILEDYDLSLYAVATDGTPHFPGDINAPGSLWLGLDYFGYDANPGSNFVIATLAGGKRDYDGVDLIFRKRYSNNWQALLSYTYNRARGNTNSDSQADFQGDYLWLDPRSPNAYARQPGNITHVFKAAGSYHTAIGVLLGASYRWNSGAYSSKTYSDFGRNLPLPSEVGYLFNGATDTWIQEGVVGTLPNPSWGQLDVRAEDKNVRRARHRVLRRHLQHHEQPVGDPHPGLGGWQRRHRFQGADPLPGSAAVLPRRTFVVLVRRRLAASWGRLSSGAGPFFVRLTADFRAERSDAFSQTPRVHIGADPRRLSPPERTSLPRRRRVFRHPSHHPRRQGPDPVKSDANCALWHVIHPKSVTDRNCCANIADRSLDSFRRNFDVRFSRSCAASAQSRRSAGGVSRARERAPPPRPRPAGLPASSPTPPAGSARRNRHGESRRTGATRELTTDSAGQYVFANLPPGAYEISAALAGFNTANAKVHSVRRRRHRRRHETGYCRHERKPQRRGRSSAINVATPKSPRPSPRRRSASSRRHTGRLRPRHRRGQRRRMTSRQQSRRGAPRGTGFNINGKRASAPTSCSTGRRTTTSSTDGRPGRAPGLGAGIQRRHEQLLGPVRPRLGGVVNVATKSGTNSFRGTAYEFYRNDKLATNTFDNKANDIEKGEFTRHQLGFSIGGPISRDKPHFFTNLEYIRVRAPTR